MSPPPTLRVVGALARRTLRQALRRPVVLTFSLGQPLLWMLFFGFLFHRFPLVDLPAGTGYLDFLAPGVGAMTVLFGASQVGVGWIRDYQTGFLQRMLATGAGGVGVLLGKLLADSLRLLVQSALVLLLAVALGARFSPRWEALPLAFLSLGLFALALAALSSALALRSRAPEVMGAFVHLVNMPLLFTSTALVPIREMPSWLAGVAAVNPLTLTVDALRNTLLFDQGVLPQTPVLLALPAVGFFLLAWGEIRRVPRS